MRRMAYSTTGFSLYSDGRGMVSVLGYGPRNMAMLSSLRSIAIVASLRHDSAISTANAGKISGIQPRGRLHCLQGRKERTICGDSGVAARKDYCTMRTQ